MTIPPAPALPDFDQITQDFECLDQWEDRYRYLIELGRMLPDFPDACRTAEYRVNGCASQVWLVVQPQPDGTLTFLGDSDAYIVRGLVALVLSLYSGRPAAEIAALDALPRLQTLDLHSHLSPQRSNGLKSMIARIRHSAAQNISSTPP